MLHPQISYKANEFYRMLPYTMTKISAIFWTCVFCADMPGFCRPSHILPYTGLWSTHAKWYIYVYSYGIHNRTTSCRTCTCLIKLYILFVCFVSYRHGGTGLSEANLHWSSSTVDQVATFCKHARQYFYYNVQHNIIMWGIAGKAVPIWLFWFDTDTDNFMLLPISWFKSTDTLKLADIHGY